MIKSVISRAGAHALARSVTRKLLLNSEHFSIWEDAGFHVTLNHFYQPVPDTRTIDPRLFAPRTVAQGVDFRDADQRALLADVTAAYRGEYEPILGVGSRLLAAIGGQEPGLGPVDAEILHGLVRRLRPRRIIEIGSGFSTLVTARAACMNEHDGGHLPDFTAIEPYPPGFLRDDVRGLAHLIQKPIQEVPTACFESLEPNDIVFIDSSHVAKLGSDVQHEFFEILPRLPKGVFVHFHDIFLPSEYPREWFLERRIFWNEQYLLHSFLMFNTSFQVVWGSSYMHTSHPAALAAAFPSYDPTTNHPASFWMVRTG